MLKWLAMIPNSVLQSSTYTTRVKCLHHKITREIQVDIKTFIPRDKCEMVWAVRCAERRNSPTFIQGFETLGAHSEVSGEPQREDRSCADDGGGQLKSRESKCQKNTCILLGSMELLLKLI